MIKLSFSTISNCLQKDNSHNWLNKQMGIVPEDHSYYHEGTQAHRIIQEHVSGTKFSPLLAHINKKFSIVETRDLDPACHFEFSLKKILDPSVIIINDYLIHGYIDGMNDDEFLEIKTSGVPWSMGKFKSSFQRKIYALSNPNFTNSYLITAKRNQEEWKIEPPKIYKVPISYMDRGDALLYILEAVRVLESGEFRGGLNEDGVCDNPRCYYGNNCIFKDNAY